MASRKKNISARTFLPAGATKKHSCPGDFFGTFGPKVPAFSSPPAKKKPYVKEKPNMLTNPGKKGGPGVLNTTINKYPEHGEKPDPYDESRNRQRKQYMDHMKGCRAGPLLSMVCPQPYFEKNPYYTENPVPQYKVPVEKKYPVFGQGKFLPSSPAKWGKEGCLNKFPEYKSSPYVSANDANRKKNTEKKVFYPEMRLKPKPTVSVVNHNVDICVNAKNWDTFTPIVYPISMI